MCGCAHFGVYIQMLKPFEYSHFRRFILPVALAGLSTIALSTTALSTTVFAASHQGGTDHQNATEAPIVVTANRTAQTASEAISSVTVLTREDIEKRQARSVEDLLRGETGMQLINSGGRGKLTTLLMRGTNADHVLVLVDGIKVGSATSGLTPFQDLPVDQIERIEIVRGPRSSLYGSEAIGGVIQIFTRKGGGELTPSLRMTAGSDQTYQAAGGLSGSNASVFYNIALSGNHTRGFDSCKPEAATNFTACFTDEPDDDGYKNISGSARLGMELDDGGEISLSYLHSDNKTEYDGDFQNKTETVQQVAGLSASFSLTDIWWLKIVAGLSIDDSENFNDGAFANRYDTTRKSLSLQNDIFLFDRDTLSIGIDYLQDDIDTDGDQNADGVIDDADQFSETKRDNTGIFAQYLAALGRHDIELNARHDDNEQFGSKLTGGIGYGVQLRESLRFVSSYGTAFKAPSFNQLYFPGFGNPDLKPEEAKSIELGFRGRHQYPGGGGNITHWSLLWFDTRVDELIGFDTEFNSVNIDKAKIKGVEFNYDSQVYQHWLVGLGFTWQSPKSDSGTYAGNLLPRRAKRMGRFDLDYLASRWSLGATLTANSRSYDDQANTRELGAWQTIDIRSELRIHEYWQLQAKIENLFDHDYETASDYNQPGRSFFVTLLYKPE